jgi:cephalosporin hydroxylase
MVILDSDHTYKHVLQELREYSKFVTSGQYLICCDTAIEFQPPAPLRPRDWGKGNSPKTAIDEFLGSEIGDNFSIDKSVDMKLLMSNNWGGYLLRK